MLKKGPKDLVELTTGTQQYLIAHKQQPRGKTTSTVHPKRAKQRKPTQSKLDTTQERRGTQITWKVPKSNSNGLTSNDGQETKTDGMKFK